MPWQIDDVDATLSYAIYGGFDSSGNPHIGYNANGTLKHAWRVSGVWYTETLGTTPMYLGGSDFGFAIRDDVMHAVWLWYDGLRVPGGPNTNCRITHVTATVGGSWTTTTHNMPDYGAYAGTCQVAIDSTGAYHVFWVGWYSDLPGRAIYVPGSSWTPSIVYENARQVGYARPHAFFCDSNDDLHAVWWAKGAIGDTEHAYYWGGGSVQDVIAVPTEEAYWNSAEPGPVAANADGDVKIVNLIYVGDAGIATGQFVNGPGGAIESWSAESYADLLPVDDVWWAVDAPYYAATLTFKTRSVGGVWSRQTVTNMAGENGYWGCALLRSPTGWPGIAYGDDSGLHFAGRLPAMDGRWTMMALL
jgi:hypothetical protein